MRYRVRRIAVGPLVRQAAAVGALAALVPGALAGVVFVATVHALRVTLESWRSVRLPLPVIPATTVNFVDVLRLAGPLATLRSWDASPPFVLLLFVGTAAVLGALAGLAIGWASATLYNAGARVGGGFEVDLEPGEDTPIAAPSTARRVGL